MEPVVILGCSGLLEILINYPKEPYMEMKEKTHTVSLWLLMVFESF